MPALELSPSSAGLSLAPWPPANGAKRAVTVNANDSFLDICNREKCSFADLMKLNFDIDISKPSLKGKWEKIVNFYLRTKLGCSKLTPGGNYKFSGGETIFIPAAIPPPPVPSPAPVINPPKVHPFRRGWTKTTVAEFRSFVLRVAPSYANSYIIRMDCANFALHLLMEFARARNMPVAFQYSGGLLLAEIESIVNFPSFMNTVKDKIGARDLSNSSYAQTVALSGMGQLQAGDILSQANHVIVFFRSPASIEVPGVAGKRQVFEVFQGNLDAFPILTPDGLKAYPIATRVQHRAFDLRIKAGYVNMGNGWEHREDNTSYQNDIVGKFAPKSWNFSWFNQLYGFPPL
jgi:hypothetical protein